MVRMLFKRHPILTTAFIIASVLSVLLMVKIVFDIIDHRASPNEPIAGWMTVGYIGEAWGLEPEEIDKRAGLPLPVKGEPKTLNQTAEDRNVPVAHLIKDVERVIAEMKSEAKE